MEKRKEKKLVELTVNPCKMCMPMGAVSAFYGIRGCMSILHGSQGCATYIRRHMATHYNEPVDVASSSLTEEGTVFGGEQNLVKGIDNLTKLYHPEVVAISTTCLAETIGEDVKAIARKYEEAHPGGPVLIVASSAGYGGTQYEGFLHALRAVVGQTPMNPAPNGTVNIVTSMISPADTDALKAMLVDMGVPFTLLPDLSENLNGGHAEQYDRLPRGGTPLDAIARMAGARMTLELCSFVQEEVSPAKHLFDTYGVPFRRLKLPVGLAATDAFLEALMALGYRPSGSLRRARSVLVDGMIDAHKYNAQARAAVFGEPDFVEGMCALLAENGVAVPVAATGSRCPALRARLANSLGAQAAARGEAFEVRDDCDFDEIETMCREHRVNLMVGSSDARRAAERLSVELIRCAFPIHDRVGGQRTRVLGYDGALTILETSANAMLRHTEEHFRAELRKKHFTPLNRTGQVDIIPLSALKARSGGAARTEAAAPEAVGGGQPDAGPDKMAKSGDRTAETARRTQSHPCFACSGGKFARIHLPVAPLCNIQCGYCVRDFDCPNESRPGVTTKVLSAEEALSRYEAAKAKVNNLSVVGIAGPGDALANFESTRRTLELIREKDPAVTFCLSTNGLMLPRYAREMVDLGVTHVTVTLNAVNPEIGAKIYRHIDYMGKRYKGVTGASMLLSNQMAGIRMLADRGVAVKVNIVALSGINDGHIPEVVRTAKALGAKLTNIMQMIPVKGSPLEHLGQLSMKRLGELRDLCAQDLQQMRHCRQCRADAVGTLDEDRSAEFCGAAEAPVPLVPVAPDAPGCRLAVASRSGMLVDQHFGHAEAFLIYQSDGVTARFVEQRPVPRYCAGPEDCDGKDSKIERMISAISDCRGVLALRIGDSPAEKLKGRHITPIATYDRIESAVNRAAQQLC